MEFGKHLGKGLWGIADKSLAVAYGVGFVLLVIRVLPKEELGNFVLLQELFLVMSGLANAVALQPLLKFAAEEREDYKDTITASLYICLSFVVVSSGLTVLFRYSIADLLNSPALSSLLLYMPLLMAASFVRNFVLILLQSKLYMRSLFWTDAVHFLGFPILVWVLSKFGRFDTAEDLVHISLATFTVSSILGWWLSRSLISLTLRPSREEFLKVWDYGKFSLGGIVSYLFYSKADSFILSAFTGPVQVAVYTSVKIFIRIYEMVTQVVQMFVLPITSRLSSRGEFDRLKAVVEKGIAFTTIGLVPVSILFVAFAPILLDVLYQGRYAEAAPMLQVFSLLTLFVPVHAVATNTLMGLGRAKDVFVVGVVTSILSIIIYYVLARFFGPLGISIGFVCVTGLFAFFFTKRLQSLGIRLTARKLFNRFIDIQMFTKTLFRRANSS